MISHFELSIIIGTRGNIWLCGYQLNSGICHGTLHRTSLIHININGWGSTIYLLPLHFQAPRHYFSSLINRRFSRTRHVGSFYIHKTLSGVIIKGSNPDKIKVLLFSLLPFSIVFVPAGFKTVLE
jgi:hypothetical protein